MSHPTQIPSALPSLIGNEVENEVANEVQNPSPVEIHNLRTMIIAIDGEGGIPFARKLKAYGGRARNGEAHTGAVLPTNHQLQSGVLESHTPVSPNPIPSFFPSGMPIHDPLVFASQLAQHYSDRQGQVPTMTNPPVADAITRHE